MGDDSFRSVYSDILGKYNNREGIVIDTRFNGCLLYTSRCV